MRGEVALQVDIVASANLSLPCYQGPLHEVRDLVVWRKAFCNPECWPATLSDTRHGPAKALDGRMWGGLANVALCHTAPALMSFTEQPATHFREVARLEPMQEQRTTKLGDLEGKYMAFYANNCSKVPGLPEYSTSPEPKGTTGWREEHITDDTERDVIRAGWEWFPRTVAAIAEHAQPLSTVANYQWPRQDQLVESMADYWDCELGLPLPAWYANADARPTTSAEREYVTTRGAGDNRVLRGVVSPKASRLIEADRRKGGNLSHADIRQAAWTKARWAVVDGSATRMQRLVVRSLPFMTLRRERAGDAYVSPHIVWSPASAAASSSSSKSRAAHARDDTR